MKYIILKAKVKKICTLYHFPITIFTIIYGLQIIYVYSICMVQILYNNDTLCNFSQLLVLISSLKLALVGYNTINQDFCSPKTRC